MQNLDKAPSPKDIAQVRANRERLAPHIRTTPCLALGLPAWLDLDLWLKLELLQVTGTFKPRGAMTVIQSLPDDVTTRGVVTVSSGNHAIATAYCAARRGAPATVFMSKAADPFRVEKARGFGAVIHLVDDNMKAFAAAREMAGAGGPYFVHPFDGPYTSLGTATIALELDQQLPQVDAVVLAIGGGSLASGLSAALKSLRPTTRIYGFEPEGAALLRRSLDEGRPVRMDRIDTIADSLAPPFSEAYSFGLIRDHVDDVLLVPDRAIVETMALVRQELGLRVEPAAVTAIAGLISHPQLALGSACAVVCGSNIGLERYRRFSGEA